MEKDRYFEVTWKNSNDVTYFYGKDIKDALSNAGLGNVDMKNIDAWQDNDVKLPWYLKEVLIIKHVKNEHDIMDVDVIHRFPFDSIGPLVDALRQESVFKKCPLVPTNITFYLNGIQRRYSIYNEPCRLVCKEIYPKELIDGGSFDANGNTVV